LLKNKLLINFFSSGLQAIAVQVLGSIFFYFISIYLSKEIFGVINLMNAVCLFVTTLLGFGLEQVVTRRIAASKRSDWAAAAFFAHSLIGFLLTALVLLILNAVFKNQAGIYRYLPCFFAAQGLIYIGIPLKQFLNAKERFTPYGIIAVISNIGKIVMALLMQKNHRLNIHKVIIILIGAAVFELACLLIYILTKTDFSFKLHFNAYKKLLKESSAQYLSVIFDMSLSRMDWILVGIIAGNSVVLADYSFAYRAFELARLPVFIIAPVLLPRLARLMSSNNKPGVADQQQINSFIKTEMFFAVLIPLILNILWVPLVSLITKGKYGNTNSLQFLILSLCIPFQFSINMLWSLTFGAKKYKRVTFITIVCATVNVLLNVVLIKKFNGVGAAVAFFITTLLQGYLYYKLVCKEIMVLSLSPLLLFITAAIVYVIATSINVHFVIQLIIAIALYLSVAVLSKQISRQHIYDFKQFLS